MSQKFCPFRCSKRVELLLNFNLINYNLFVVLAMLSLMRFVCLLLQNINLLIHHKLRICYKYYNNVELLTYTINITLLYSHVNVLFCIVCFYNSIVHRNNLYNDICITTV